MATNKPRVLLTLDDELLKKIDDYRFKNRFNTRNDAIRKLIESGLENEEKGTK